MDGNTRKKVAQHSVTFTSLCNSHGAVVASNEGGGPVRAIPVMLCSWLEGDVAIDIIWQSICGLALCLSLSLTRLCRHHHGFQCALFRQLASQARWPSTVFMLCPCSPLRINTRIQTQPQQDIQRFNLDQMAGLLKNEETCLIAMHLRSP